MKFSYATWCSDLFKSQIFDVPKGVREAAKRGLELRRKHKRGGLSTKQAKRAGVGSGVQRAVNLMNGRVSYQTIKRMRNFFSRHSAFKEHHKDKTSAAYISWLLWGGDAGERWSNKIVEQTERKELKKGLHLNRDKELKKELPFGDNELEKGLPFGDNELKKGLHPNGDNIQKSVSPSDAYSYIRWWNKSKLNLDNSERSDTNHD